MENQNYYDFEERWALIEEQKDAEAKLKIERLNKEAKLIPLKQEIISHIDSFISWLDLSNEWFLKSRDLKLSDEERKLNLVIYGFYEARAGLILEELFDFLPKELQNG